MPISLLKYKSIKDNYCISYYGINKEYVVQLKLLRPIIEDTYKGLIVYICCNDDCKYILKDEKRVFFKSELHECKSNFSYIREITDSIEYHPVEWLMKESEIACGPIRTKTRNCFSRKCALLTNGIFPSRSLSAKQINFIEKEITSNGYKVIINPDLQEIINDFQIVVGVENEVFYESCANGLHATLIPTGIGENLFKNMFPNNKIINLID